MNMTEQIIRILSKHFPQTSVTTVIGATDDIVAILAPASTVMPASVRDLIDDGKRASAVAEYQNLFDVSTVVARAMIDDWVQERALDELRDKLAGR